MFPGENARVDQARINSVVSLQSRNAGLLIGAISAIFASGWETEAIDKDDVMTRTYCYDGDCGITANQLLWVIAAETAMEELGISDAASALAIVSGANIIPTRTKPGGAVKDTSIASIVFRRALRKSRFPGGYRAPTIVGWNPPRLRRTPNVGAFIARAIPVVGWAYTAAELGIIGYKTVALYNSLVSSEDQVF